MTEKELKFLETFNEQIKTFENNKIATAEEVVMRICYLYLTAEKDSDKEETVWLINKLNKKYKKQALNYIDFDEKYTELLKNRKKKQEKITRINQKRRHQKREDFSLTPEQWEETCNHFDYGCVYCGKYTQLTYDHFIPFSKGGSFGQENILPCCKLCNSRKNNKDFNEWYRNQLFYSEDKEKVIIDFINSKIREAMLI